MKVLFTIWAKVGTQNNTEQHRTTQKRPFCTRTKLDEKNNPNYLLYKIIVYLCSMKLKHIKRMKTEKIELVALLAIIATGTTLSGSMIGSTTFAAIGATMYLIPIYVGIVGNKYF